MDKCVSFLAFVVFLCINLACGSDIPTMPSFSVGGPGTLITSQQKVWFVPALGSVDMRMLFTNPELWDTARSKIHVFQVYKDNYQHTGAVGNNTSENLVASGMYKRLREWGIKFAVDAASVKEFTCNEMPDVTLRDTLHILQRINNDGGTVDYLVMDDPMDSGVGKCYQSVETTALQVSYWMKGIKQAYPSVEIGTSDAYPVVLPEEFDIYFQALREYGTPLEFFFVDIDLTRVMRENRDFIGEMRKMQDICAKENIKFGVIVFGGDNHVYNSSYFAQAMQTVQSIKRAVGPNVTIIFQSWSSTLGDTSSPRSIPNNVPEEEPFTHTYLINEALEYLKN